MHKLLIIDADPKTQPLVEEALPSCEVSAAATVHEGLALLSSAQPEAVILAVTLPDGSGLDAHRAIREQDPKLPVILVSLRATSDLAIDAMRLGAFDYLVKPIHPDLLRDAVGRAIAIRQAMSNPVRMAPESGPEEMRANTLIGSSAPMQSVYKAIGLIAPQDLTVLIRGESGTGKELVARAIYHNSQRSDRPYFALNCAAIPETLLESELFGHERGAFTGADRLRIGRFEQNDTGTLFLDEIGDMPHVLQSKILRVLQDQTFTRVGGDAPIATDVRIIAATNRNLGQLVRDREFREDLFYRLNAFTIYLPPLRERGEDVLELTEAFLRIYSPKFGKTVDRISVDAADRLMHYAWPGNVRELENAILHALVQARGNVLLPSFLPPQIARPEGHAAMTAGSPSEWIALDALMAARLAAGTTELYKEAVNELERYLLPRVLTLTRGNQAESARLLGMARNTLRARLRSLGLVVERSLSVRDDSESEGAPSPSSSM